MFLNKREGNFLDAFPLSSEILETNSLEVGDVNNDGYADIISGNGAVNNGQSNWILLNHGDGTFVTIFSCYLDENMKLFLFVWPMSMEIVMTTF